MEENLIIRPEIENGQEERLEKTLRPQSFDEYIGQSKVKENMEIYIEAAKKKRRTTRSLLVLWTTRFRKNNNCKYNCK